MAPIAHVTPEKLRFVIYFISFVSVFLSQVGIHHFSLFFFETLPFSVGDSETTFIFPSHQDSHFMLSTIFTETTEMDLK